MLHNDDEKCMALFVYVDESGHPKQLNDGPYVLASVIIDDKDLKNVSSQIMDFIETVRKKYNISRLEEIHTKDLVKGSREWHGIDMGIRVQVFNDFANLIAGLDILLNIVVAMKAMKNVVIRNPDGVMARVITNLIERLFMTKPLYPNHSTVTLVFDESGSISYKSIDKNIKDAFKYSRAKQSFKYSDIILMIKSSKDVPPIQIADYVAYVVGRIFNRQFQYREFDLKRAFHAFEDKIRKCPNKNTYRGCGLKVWEIK